MSAHGLNLLVFRDGRRQVSGAELRCALMAQLEGFSDASPADLKTGALLRTGEFECAVADAFGSAASMAELTDVVAEAYLGAQLPDSFPRVKDTAAHAQVPEQMTLSSPEGFAYYALQPLAYARALDKLPDLPERLVVVGIRSIGTTLSAVTAGAARLRGSQASRFTVRPVGHPYNRRTEFSANQLQIIQSGISNAAGFWIVDEGPGLSGSSFLSVAEGLEAAGVARERILLLCAHEPNPDALCSADAAVRWRRFSCVSAPSGPSFLAGTGAFAGAGQWRSRWFQDESRWPAVWSNMERLKYLWAAENGELRLFKFAGLGHYGDSVLERETRAAAEGFAPMPRREENGFVSYSWLDGRPMAAGHLNHQVIARLAEYCAFRARELSVAAADLQPLEEMAGHNLADLGFGLSVSLRLERPVIADGHMQPHEWIMTHESRMLKTDSGSHGDDHFYPGPTDIAWDLAGAMVEWRMSPQKSAEFLDLYHRLSGDHASTRIDDFIRAYAVFRYAYCKMAAHAMPGTAEQERLEHAAADYACLLAANSKFALGLAQTVPATPAR